MKYRKNTENKYVDVKNTTKGKIMLLCRCMVCGNKKIQVHQKSKNLWIGEPISNKTPSEEDTIMIFFYKGIKMNNIIKIFMRKR